MEKSILFVPSNRNHVQIFFHLLEHVKDRYNVLFVTQGSYKNEGAEEELQNLGLNYETFDTISNSPMNLLQRENIGVVIVGNDTDVIPQLFINIADRLDIPSVLIQDGLMFDVIKNKIPKQLHLKLLFLEIKLLLSKQYHRISDGESRCTQIHVWGKTSEEYFLKKGIPRDKILITGAIGNIFTTDETRHNPKKPLVLMARTNTINSKILTKKQFEELFNNMCAVVVDCGMALVIKPHPADDKKFFSRLVDKHKTFTTISDDDVLLLLDQCTVLITDFSTIGIKALQKRIPVITYFPNISKYIDSNTYPLDLINSNIIMHAENQHELSNHLKSVSSFSFDSLSLDKVLANYIGPNDNGAAKRSALHIIHLLER